MATIAASILSADPLHLAEAARRVVACGADALHLNVIGSEYRPNLTLGHFVCAALRPHVQVPVHAHLHVPASEALIEAFAEAGADLILVHAGGADVPAALRHIRRVGCKAGLAFASTESVEVLPALLGDVDVVHLSCAGPAPTARRFMPQSLGKLARARQLIDAAGAAVPLQADGDLNVGNIRRVADAGADAFVVGRALFSAPDPVHALRALREQLAVADVAAVTT